MEPIAREKLDIFCRKWGIRELSLFGSVLRDDFNPESDIDVLLSFHPNTDWSYWNWPEMEDELKEIFGRTVDIVLDEGLKNPFRRNEILRTRMVVYAQ